MKSDAPEYIAIGKILSPWGVDGSVKVQIATDFPERYAPEAHVFVAGQPAVIEDVAWSRGKALVKLDIVHNLEASKKLQGKLLEIHRSQLNPLPDGFYYHFQLVGMQVVTTSGESLGEIVDVIASATNDTYVVRADGEEILIPATEDVIKSVDVDCGQMVIEPIKGLLDLNKKAAR